MVEPAHLPVGSGVDMHLGARRGAPSARQGFSIGAFAVSIIFTVLLIAAPEQLDSAWRWFRDLPIVFEIIGWIALAPWLLAWLAWNATWALWIRVVLVVFLVWGVALSFWHNRSE